MKVAIVLAVWLLLVMGYVLNIVKLAECDFASPYKAEVVRTVGVFIPFVGAVTGYIRLGK